MAALSVLEGPRGRRIAAASLVVLWAFFFHVQIFSRSFAYYRDNLITCVPVFNYLRQRLCHFEWPQWFPYEALGVPFVGQIATGLFHPLTWLLLPLPVLEALKWQALLSYLAASFGAYQLARVLGGSRLASVTAGVAFAFGGYLLGVSNVLFYLMGTATLPWVAWAAVRLARHRRLHDAALLGTLWALLFLAADMPGFVCSGLFLLIALASEGLHRRMLGLFALAIVTALLISSVELIPGLLMGKESARLLGTPSPTLGITWALHPWRLVELAVPGFLPDALRFRVTAELFHGGTSVFATTLFTGASVLVLAGLGLASKGRKAAPWVLLGTLAVLLALGDRVGVLPAAKVFLPMLRRFRYPEKYIAFFWVALIPLVAWGVDALAVRPRRAIAVWCAGGLALVMAAAFVGTHGVAAELWRSAGSAFAPSDPARELLDASWARGLAFSAAFLLAGGVLLLAALKLPALRLALPLLVFLELWHGNGAHFPVLPVEKMTDANPFAAALLHASENRGTVPLARATREVEVNQPLSPTGAGNALWVEANRLSLKPDLGAWEGITSLGENLGGTTARYVELFGPKAVRAPRFGGLFNACFRVVDSRRPLRPGERVLERSGELNWSLLESPCWPRAFLAGTLPVASAAEGVAALERGHVDLARVPWEGPAMELSPGSVRWVENAPEHGVLEVDATHATALVVSDQLVRGWTAQVDGQDVPLHPTLVVARGVELPAGHHRVDFRYQTPGFLLGRVLASLGLLLAAVLGGMEKRRARLSAHRFHG